MDIGDTYEQYGLRCGVYTYCCEKCGKQIDYFNLKVIYLQNSPCKVCVNCQKELLGIINKRY